MELKNYQQKVLDDLSLFLEYVQKHRKTKTKQYIIYADNCLLSKEFLQQHNIIFKKIPRDITRS
jgi:hypothetical protein